MESPTRTYGDSLPDQVDLVARLSDAQLTLLGDIREIYSDRAALEREHATKLQALAKKALDKKLKKVAAAVVGDEPTKDWNEDTISQSTLDNMYNKVIGSMTNAAQDHINLSDAFTSQVVDVLKTLERKTEDNGKKASILGFDYDDECLELETYRQKQDRAHDDKHAGRAAKQYEQQQADMLNAKNIYLIATTVANKTKDRFYAEDLLNLENTHFIAKYISILHHAQALQLTHYDALKNRVTSVETALDEVNPRKDQELFIEHNIRPFTAPIDWVFEPCSKHYDTGDMSVDSMPKVYLQNKLSKCRSKLQELIPLLDAKRKEADHLGTVVTAYTQNQSLGSVDEVMENYLEAQHQATLYENSKTILNAEIETITTALAGTSYTSSITNLAPPPTPSSFAQTDLHTQKEEDHPQARVVFDFTPTSPFELAVREGATVHVLEEDDGSGWVKVADTAGEKGLVPASYIEPLDARASAPSAQAPTSKHAQGSGKYGGFHSSPVGRLNLGAYMAIGDDT
ncbi:hypothetical protein EW146_g844 [Bondarzewia mesenterica]|uniref:SH3 domain-containing protein n=1 Tax=Bondarzewia mesenterica TaxID=1095465 RepID=A0A4S4M5P2_9AGAM|nr:hypothetical protein EW146_g844 [Bondarzewia mesenterica]